MENTKIHYLLEGKKDNYGGIIIDHTKFPSEVHAFEDSLKGISLW